jgi:hypothetical protein
MSDFKVGDLIIRTKENVSYGAAAVIIEELWNYRVKLITMGHKDIGRSCIGELANWEIGTFRKANKLESYLFGAENETV